MAIRFETNLNLNKNELQNLRLQNLTAHPSSPVVGQKYFNTTDQLEYIYTTGGWKASGQVYIHPDHTGDVTSSGDGATTITNDAVSNAKLANMAATTIKGRKEASSGDPQDLTAAEVRALINVADGANNYVHPGSGTNPHGTTKTDVGLGNVTDNAQVKKAASSINGNIPVWSGTTGDALGSGYSVETSFTGSSSAIARADAVKAYVDGLLGASDAMIFKGIINASSNPNYPAADTGHSYKISVAGKIGGASGVNVEIGDMIICTVDGSAAGTQAAVGANWTIVQTNLDGAVIGPASAVTDRIATFSGTSGKLIKDSGYTAASFASSSHNHDSSYTKKYTAAIGGSTSIVVTHNLGTRDLVATIREVASPYAVVYADIEFTSTTTATIKFATAPAAGAYQITLVG